MAITDENNGTGMVMPVQPLGGYGGGLAVGAVASAAVLAVTAICSLAMIFHGF